MNASGKAHVLAEALPYIRRFWDKVVVVKYGGAAMDDPAQAVLFAQDIVLMRSVGMRPVVVHGGGPQIGQLMARLGKEPEFRDGLRVTDADTLDIARMVLVGKVNRDIVSAINVHAPLAVGMSGEDAGLITATARSPELGFVGDVDTVNASILERVLAQGLIPVVATIGSDVGGQAYNINADTAAGAVAEALGAEKLVYLTNVEGLRSDADDPATLDLVDRGRRARGHDRVGRARRWDDPEGDVVRARGAQGRRPRPHPRRPHAARPAARDLHARGHRHHGEPVNPNPLMPTYPEPPVTFVRGEGARLWDVDGKRYLDFLSGLAVTSLGHAHPEVADALCDQARTLLHVSNLFGTIVGSEVAATLDRLIGGPSGRVFFCNSGAEANECAIKLARKWAGPGRYAVVSAYGSFHGRTLATLHATGQPQKHEPFQPLPEGFRHVAWDDLDALDASLDASVVAAVLLEPVQGEGGVNPATPAYFQGVRRLCDERGCLLIVDEVQTGLGRTGSGSASSTSASSPTSSPWPRRSATACPSVRAGRATTSPPPSSPATTPRPSAGSRWQPPRRARCSR